MDSITVGLKGMLTSLRRAGTLGEAVGANKPARPSRRRAVVTTAIVRPLLSLLFAAAAEGGWA
jgi:hypothetical protein